MYVPIVAAPPYVTYVVAFVVFRRFSARRSASITPRSTSFVDVDAEVSDESPVVVVIAVVVATNAIFSPDSSSSSRRSCIVRQSMQCNPIQSVALCRRTSESATRSTFLLSTTGGGKRPFVIRRTKKNSQSVDLENCKDLSPFDSKRARSGTNERTIDRSIGVFIDRRTRSMRDFQALMRLDGSKRRVSSSRDPFSFFREGGTDGVRESATRFRCARTTTTTTTTRTTTTHRNERSVVHLDGSVT